MWTAIIAITSLGAACALWALLQRWISKSAPDLPGVERRCADCPHSATCERPCPERDSDDKRHLKMHSTIE